MKWGPTCKLLTRRVVRTKTERTLVRIDRLVAWSGSLTTASLVTPGAIPFGRLYVVSDSLRRHAYTVIVEGMMSTGQSSAKPAGLSQLNLNAAGIDVGATSHFVAVPANHGSSRCESLPPSRRTCIAWLTG